MKLLTQFSGVVLTGGASQRMGRDKALLEVADRVPLVLVAARALHDAGAHDVTCIGGDGPRLEGFGLAWRPDEQPGEGPLGGLITGVRAAPLPIVVILTCDLPAIDAASVRGLVDGLDRHPEALGAMPELAGRRQVLTAAYRRAALPPLEAAYAAGERSVRRAIGDLPITVVDHLDPAALVDVDSPADLGRYARGTAAAAGPAGAGAGPEAGSAAGPHAGPDAGPDGGPSGPR